jgi:hypothetical protein
MATVFSPAVSTSASSPAWVGSNSVKQDAEQPNGNAVLGLGLEAEAQWPPAVPSGVTSSDVSHREGPVPLPVHQEALQPVVEPEATEQTVDYSVHNMSSTSAQPSVAQLQPDASGIQEQEDQEELLHHHHHQQLLSAGYDAQGSGTGTEGSTPVPDHVLAAQASASRLRVRELLPSQDVESVRLQALTRLNGELEGLVEGIRREIEAVHTHEVPRVLKVRCD